MDYGLNWRRDEKALWMLSEAPLRTKMEDRWLSSVFHFVFCASVFPYVSQDDEGTLQGNPQEETS